MPLTDGQFGVVYLAQRDPLSVWVCCCLEDLFTPLVKTYLSVNDVSRPAFLLLYRETWPLVMELLDNGMNGRHNPAALLTLEDPDDATGKWYVTSVVGNLPALTVEYVFSGRTQETVQRVFDITDRTVREFRTWNLDRTRLGAKLFSASVTRDVTAYAGFVKDNFGTIVGLLGS